MKETVPLLAAMTLLAATALLASSCGGPTRADTLTELADTTIVPMFNQLEQSSAELAQAGADLCAEPSAAKLASAHDSLTTVRIAWSISEAAWVGPVMQRRSWAVIDWPVATAEIESLITDTSVALDIDRLGKAVGADQRGLGAVEYLLGEPGDTSNLESRFDSRRCDYLISVAQVIHTEATLLQRDWAVAYEDAAPYREQFGVEGTMSLDDLVNDTLFLLEDMGDRELGVALGMMSGDADLGAVVEGSSGLGSSDMASHLRGLRAVLIGGDVEGHQGLAPLLGDAITSRLDGQLTRAQTAADAVGSPLRSQVVDNRDAVMELRDAIKDIQVTVATEVVSHLGVTIGFSDADGDTGA